MRSKFYYFILALNNCWGSPSPEDTCSKVTDATAAATNPPSGGLLIFLMMRRSKDPFQGCHSLSRVRPKVLQCLQEWIRIAKDLRTRIAESWLGRRIIPEASANLRSTRRSVLITTQLGES